jgi:hypothetical protein
MSDYDSVHSTTANYGVSKINSKRQVVANPMAMTLEDMPSDGFEHNRNRQSYDKNMMLLSACESSTQNFHSKSLPDLVQTEDFVPLKERLSDVRSYQMKRRSHKASRWRPLTIRPCFLFGTGLLLVLMLATIEYLRYTSSRDGGLSFADSLETLPKALKFMSSIGMTIVAVAFSMLWNWIDLDVKRMEPFFQLAKEEGATAKDSLLLTYPVEFLPLVPLTAFRKRYEHIENCQLRS